MDRRDLVNRAAAAGSLTRSEIEEALDVILDTIADALAVGECVTIKNFGCFSMEPYPAHEVHDFQAARRRQSAAGRRPVWKSSKSLRRRLRETSAGGERP